MDLRDLRVALFSGNYSYVPDGANQARQRLVASLRSRGAAVRVYSPTLTQAALGPRGGVLRIESLPIPGRPDHRLPLRLPQAVKRDLQRFGPDIVQVASPDLLCHGAISLARRIGCPVVASVHTRFETYPRYYGAPFAEPLLLACLRRFYRRCDAIFAPSPSMAQLLRDQGMNRHVGLWGRGVDRDIFNPGRRSLEWRRGLGIADDMPVIGFVGRLAKEKGLAVLVETMATLERRGVRHMVVVVGKGPAGPWLERRLPRAAFTGLLTGAQLGTAVASMDMMFTPSTTETFGNSTLEAMACSVPVVGANSSGTRDLVQDEVTGRLIGGGDIDGFADALAHYCRDAEARRAAGRAAMEISRRYSWEGAIGGLIDGYRRVIRRQGYRGTAQPAWAMS
jgi:glycosyltransferase involved in cell wall biosynthesis